MSRAKKFAPGDRVCLTDEGQLQRLQGRAKSPNGFVTEVKRPSQVRVRRDGIKNAEWYHVDFWESADAG